MKTLITDIRKNLTGDFTMTENTTNNEQTGKSVTEILRDSLMVIVTLIFVLLYAAAFAGKFDPLKDNTLLLRLEPIIFILIGYYFARRPSRQSEQLLKEEITRLTQKTDAAQYAKEKAQLEREVLEEKIKNARAALKMSVSKESNNHQNAQTETIKTVVGILDS